MKRKKTRLPPHEQPLIARIRARASTQAREFFAMAQLERWQRGVSATNTRWLEQSIAALRLAFGLEHLPREWYWSESAMLMTEVLRQQVLHADEPARLTLPSENFYFEMASPFASPCGAVGAVCLLNHARSQDLLDAIHWYKRFFPSAETRQSFDEMAQRIKKRYEEEPSDPGWTLHVFGEDGTCLFTIALQVESVTNKLFSCGIAYPICADCTSLGKFVEREAMCPRCQEAHLWFMAWMAIALQMLSGVYQQTPPEEGRRPSSTNPEEIRTVTEWPEDPPRKSFPGTPKTHRMRVVRFDACIRSARRPTQQRRGSWLAGRTIEEALRTDLDPNAVIYVAHSYGYKREYRADRYKKSGLVGTKQDIQVPKRRVPITVGTLLLASPRTRVKVQASAYEGRVLPDFQIVQEAQGVQPGDKPAPAATSIASQERSE